MALPLIPIISGLVSLAPSIGKLIAGDKGEQAAQAVADIAREVTGSNDVDKAVKQIQGDPQAQLAFLKMLEQNKTKLDELYLADRQNARAMYGKHNEQADKIADRVMKWNIAYAVIIALAQIIALTQFTDLPDSVVIIIGNVSGWIIKGVLDERKDVTGFYFGSSIGSKSKDGK